MITSTESKSSNFLKIVFILRELRNDNKITAQEYYKAKSFYKKLIGADIFIDD